MTPHDPGVCAVTGASGYVGSIIVQALRPHMPVVEMVRNPASASAIKWSLDSASRHTGNPAGPQRQDPRSRRLGYARHHAS